MSTHQAERNAVHTCGGTDQAANRQAWDAGEDCSPDAGYESEAELESSIEQKSEIVATDLAALDADAVMTLLDEAGIPSEQDWDAGTTTWTSPDGAWAVVVCGADVDIRTPAATTTTQDVDDQEVQA